MVTFFVIYNDNLKKFLVSDDNSLNKLEEAFSRVDQSIPGKFQKMLQSINSGSKCEVVIANVRNKIIYSVVLMETDRVKECFTNTISAALGINQFKEYNLDEKTMLTIVRSVYGGQKQLSTHPTSR